MTAIPSPSLMIASNICSVPSLSVANLRPLLSLTDVPQIPSCREKVKKTRGRGRACLEIWPNLGIATVIKRTEKKRVVEVTRKMTLASLALANKLLQGTRGGAVLNTAFIERFNGTMRERLASLTRKCRHAAHRIAALSIGMYLIGCTYNWCFPHHELSNSKHFGHPCTPAMASGLQG